MKVFLDKRDVERKDYCYVGLYYCEMHDVFPNWRFILKSYQLNLCKIILFWSSKISWLLTIIQDDLKAVIIFHKLNAPLKGNNLLTMKENLSVIQVTFYHVSNYIDFVRDSLGLENKGFFEPTVHQMLLSYGT